MERVSTVTPKTTIKELGGRVLGIRRSQFIVYTWVKDGTFDFRLFPRSNSKFEIRKILPNAE